MTPVFADPPRSLPVEPVGQRPLLRCRLCPIQVRRDGLPPGPPAFPPPALLRRLLDPMLRLQALHRPTSGTAGVRTPFTGDSTRGSCRPPALPPSGAVSGRSACESLECTRKRERLFVAAVKPS